MLEYRMKQALPKTTALKPILFEDFQHLNREFSSHHHESYSVGITHGGRFLSSYGNSTYTVYSGGTRILNPMEAHGGSSQEWTLTNFYPTVSLMRSIYAEIFYEPKTPLFESHVIEDSQLYRLLGTFFSSIYRGAEEMETESAMIEALSWLILHYTHRTKNPETYQDSDAIRRTIELIHDTVQMHPSLTRLAEEAGMSKYHYLRTFKKHTGLTPHQYSLSVRIQKATEEIIAGASIIEASIESGFSDQSHFTRHFKRIYGYTPHKIVQKRNIVLYNA